MKYISVIFLFSFFVSCYYLSSKQKKEDLTKIKVYSEYMLDTVGTQKERIEIFITHYKNLFLYELPYNKSYSSGDKLIYDSLIFEKFIYNPSGQSYKINEITDSLLPEKNIEKILKSRAWKESEDIYIANPETKEALVNVKKPDSNTVISTYKWKKMLYFDSAIFYYSKPLKNIKFSMSLILDSIYNSKLYKVETFRKKDRLKVTTGIDKEKIDNPDKIIALFEKAIKISAK
jgi:hypothetical protein